MNSQGLYTHARTREREIPREIPENRFGSSGRQITRPGRENQSSGKTGGKDWMLARGLICETIVLVQLTRPACWVRLAKTGKPPKGLSD